MAGICFLRWEPRSFVSTPMSDCISSLSESSLFETIVHRLINTAHVDNLSGYAVLKVMIFFLGCATSVGWRYDNHSIIIALLSPTIQKYIICG